MSSMDVFDRVVRHQIDLTRYSNGVVRRMLALLNRADPDLFAQLQAALESMPPESFTVERLEMLLSQVRHVNMQAYRQMLSALEIELRGFTAAELQFRSTLTQAQTSVAMTVATVVPEQVYAAALARPFQGRLLREWAEGVEAGRVARIRDAVRIGYVENQTTDQIIRRIRGTRSKGYADGIMEIDRRHAASVVQTAVSHTAGVVRDRWHEANEDILGLIVWISTMDSKTSEGCRIRDQKRYTKDHRPVGHSMPWLSGPGALHWNCRSTSVGLLKGEEDFFGTRASVDYRGSRPVGKQIDANMSYGEWLKRQPATVQDDVLGVTRGRLFRAGGLKIEQFANDRGRWLSLDELRRRNEAAFDRAGV